MSKAAAENDRKCTDATLAFLLALFPPSSWKKRLEITNEQALWVKFSDVLAALRHVLTRDPTWGYAHVRSDKHYTDMHRVWGKRWMRQLCVVVLDSIAVLGEVRCVCVCMYVYVGVCLCVCVYACLRATKRSPSRRCSHVAPLGLAGAGHGAICVSGVHQAQRQRPRYRRRQPGQAAAGTCARMGAAARTT